jgi:hypothetical protein
MGAAILFLLLIGLLFLLGLVIKAAVFLLWVAIVLAVIWVAGWFIGSGSTASGRRWYSW